MSRALRLLDDVLSLVRERDEAVLRDTVARIESMQLQLADARRELREEQDAHAETCKALSELDGRASRAERALYNIDAELPHPPPECVSESDLSEQVRALREGRDRLGSELRTVRALLGIEESADVGTMVQGVLDAADNLRHQLDRLRAEHKYAAEECKRLEAAHELDGDMLREAQEECSRLREERDKLTLRCDGLLAELATWDEVGLERDSLRADLQRAQAQLATLSPELREDLEKEQQPHPDLPAVPGHVWMSSCDRWWLYRQEGSVVVGHVYQAKGRWLLDGHTDHEYTTLAEAAAALAARVMGGGS